MDFREGCKLAIINRVGLQAFRILLLSRQTRVLVIAPWSGCAYRKQKEQ